MVWTDERSPLYRTVEKFNSAHRESSGNTASDNAGEQEPDRCRKPEPDCCHKTESEIRCEKSGRTSLPTHGAPQPGNILQRLTGDRDFLLIAALIILLLHEKADMKLILALAFIILT